jgi:hypothetical protein
MLCNRTPSPDDAQDRYGGQFEPVRPDAVCAGQRGASRPRSGCARRVGPAPEAHRRADGPGPAASGWGSGQRVPPGMTENPVDPVHDDHDDPSEQSQQTQGEQGENPDGSHDQDADPTTPSGEEPDPATRGVEDPDPAPGS